MTEEITQLPPLLPGTETSAGEYDPMDDLVMRGYAAAIHAQKSQLSPKKRHELFELFRGECRKVLEFVLDKINTLKGIDPRERLRIFDDYNAWCNSVADWVREGIFNTIDLWIIYDLVYSEIFLWQRIRIMLNITTEELKKEAERCNKMISRIQQQQLLRDVTEQNQTGHENTRSKTGYTKPIAEPPKEAAQAYMLYWVTGKTQKEVAEIVAEKLRRPVSQGQVSRWLKQYRGWRISMGLPVDKKAPPVTFMDPSVLDLGRRTDGRRTGDPLHKKYMDSD